MAAKQLLKQGIKTSCIPEHWGSLSIDRKICQQQILVLQATLRATVIFSAIC